jgi:hypothetical protein
LFTFSLDEMTFTDDEDAIDYFTTGACQSLAYEIHKLTGWTLAMLSSSPAGSPDYYAHVFVIDSEGMVIDIAGRRKLEDVRNEWPICSYLHRFWDLKEFEYEMHGWELTIRFDRNKRAKVWARTIVDLLQ